MIKKYIPWVIDDKDPQFLSTLQPPYPDNFVDYVQFITDNVSFVKVLQYFKLRFEECNTGKYTHRMVCPFRFHKGGKERTGSFRFDNKKNVFVCFGCNSSGNIVKFMYNFGAKLDDETILRRLAIIGGLVKDGQLCIPENYVEMEQEPQKETNRRVLFDIGVFLRQYLIKINNEDKYIDECEWADRVLIETDKYFALIDEENVEDAKKMYTDIINMVSDRK